VGSIPTAGAKTAIRGLVELADTTVLSTVAAWHAGSTPAPPTRKELMNEKADYLPCPRCGDTNTISYVGPMGAHPPPQPSIDWLRVVCGGCGHSVALTWAVKKEDFEDRYMIDAGEAAGVIAWNAVSLSMTVGK
jgi:hypothetical protein